MGDRVRGGRVTLVWSDRRILVAAIVAAIVISPVILVVSIEPGTASGNPPVALGRAVPRVGGSRLGPVAPQATDSPRPSGVAASLSSLPTLLGSVPRQDINNTGSLPNTTWRIVFAGDANGFGWDIGNAVAHPSGEVKTYRFTATEDHDLPAVASLLTNGLDDPIEFVSVDKAGGAANASIGLEDQFFGSQPDFLGYAIDHIDLVVDDLHIVNVTGAASEFANYTWEIWGHPIFIAFAPPSDPEGGYIFERNYSDIRVTLASDATAVVAWDGVNRSMVGSGRSWEANVTDVPDGEHTFQVWATNPSGNVSGSEVRTVVFGFHAWTAGNIESGAGPGLRVAPDGTVHLCYESADGNVHYGTKTSTGWSLVTVAYGGSGSCAIALDNEGRGHLLFGSIKHAFWDGTAWQIETVATVTPTRGASIAIDPVTDEPMVAFYDSNVFERYLVFKTRSATGTWVATIVDRDGDTGWMPSLALDSSGNPRIAYSNKNADLKFASRSDGVWDTSIIEKTALLPGIGRISLALDSTGAPHVAYAGGGPRYGTVGYLGLRYASWTGTAWNIEIVSPGPAQAVSLAIDSQDRARIAFSLVGTPPPSDDVLRDLRYAAWNGTWNIAVLSHSINSTAITLALSPAGIPTVVATSWCCGGPNSGVLQYFTVRVGQFATFSVTPAIGTLAMDFEFDPRASWDSFFPSSALQVRWDFEGDGVWDTPWIALVPISHRYVTSGRYGVHMQLTDPANLTTETEGSVVADSEPPVTTASLAGTIGLASWYTTSVEITLSAVDELTSVASISYRLDRFGWTPYTTPILVSANGPHSVQFYSSDVLGNTEASETTLFQIDSVGPTTSAAFSGTPGGAGWYVSDVQVTLSTSDAASGVASTSYRVDGGPWQLYTDRFTLGEGAHDIEAYSVDVAGNQGPTLESMVGVDRTIPTTAAHLSGTPGLGGWYRSSVVATVIASDTLSGVASLSVSIDGGAWETVSETTFSQPYDTDGSHLIVVYATDNAGNVGPQESLAFKIDQTAPVTSVRVAGAAGTNGWLRNATVTLTASDETGSGVDSISYLVDDGTQQTYTGPFELGDGAHTLEFWAADVAGNSIVRSISVNVDSIPPVITNLKPSGTVTSSTVSVSWDGSDAVSGIAEFRISVDGGSFQSIGSGTRTTVSLADGAHTIAVRAIDQAGNTADAETRVRVDTNVFSFSGPYTGIPILIILAVAAPFFVVGLLLRRRWKRKVHR